MFEVETKFQAKSPLVFNQLANALSQQYNLIPLSQSKYERGVVLLDRLAAKAKS